jgi:hypothetical protein
MEWRALETIVLPLELFSFFLFNLKDQTKSTLYNANKLPLYKAGLLACLGLVGKQGLLACSASKDYLLAQ